MRIGGSILQRTLCHLVAQALLLLLLFSTATANSINSTNSKTNRTSAEPTLVPTQIVSRTFPFVAKGVKSELVQKFIAPRHNDTENYAQYHIILLALVPTIEPDRNNDCFMAKLLPALELGIAMTQQMGFYKSYIDFTLIARDSFCSSIYGPIGFYEVLLQQPNLNAIFGLPCEYVLAPISRYAGAYDIPVITTGGSASAFGKKAGNFPTLTRLRGTQGNNLGNAVFAIISEFNWTRTALIYESDNIDDKGYSVCFFCSYVIHEKLGSRSVMQQGFDRNTWNGTKITKMLTKLSKEVRIVIMCAEPENIRRIMLTAEELNMVDSGEYVFINIEMFSRASHITWKPWYDKNDTIENNERARKAYTAILTLTPKQPNDEDYTKVSNKIKSIATEKYNYTFQENEDVSAFVTSFFDGVLLYAKALNDSIRDDPTVLTRPINGTDIVRRMWGRSFKGITGNVTIDNNGDRISAYSLLDMNPHTGHFEIVADFMHNRLDFVPGKEIHWAGGRKEPPPSTPICGYDGSLCPDNSLPGYAILSIILGVVVVLMTVGFFFGYRHYKSEAEINSMTWKISISDLVCPDLAGRGIRGSFHSLVRHSSQLTLMSEDLRSLCGDRQIFIPVGMYRGCEVAIKAIENRQINLTRSLMLELKSMKDLQHDHLVKFYGACLDPPKRFLLTEYCPKGSLQDILENEQFQLDWMIKLSLMHDIVRGMHFLHNSVIRSHGNLKSSNCVVDSRFVLKITDFGLHTLKRVRPEAVENDVEDCNSHAYWSKLFWTAPELLKMENNGPPEGTQKGDVYSFGIIVHEISTRQGPFYLGKTESEKSPKEIIQLVKSYPEQISAPFRPFIDNLDGYLDINNLMIKCWAEDPLERPDFNALKSIIRRINKDNETGNIVDNLLKRMELYANNLEELVEERTQDYIEEKKKCEKLLYQLLPQSVAAQLISGQPVVAETFDQVTIYFSDIVGFTAISAESTPLQVVQFLNDLYTCFDSIVENFDVYKVETIGDAYMVVSGLPIRNGNQHAREIARLALALLGAVHKFRIHHRPQDQLKLRIGLHTGACVAGVVGLKMPRYCLFGDTVNTASRMESNGEALRIHISENTKLALDDFGTFITTQRGYVPMKGKGEMLTYWLEGEMSKPESPSMPSQQMLLSRRSSLKHPPQRYSVMLQKQQSEISETMPTSPTPIAVQNDIKGTPTLRVKRKISSSSPKLNGNEFKPEDFNYYLDNSKQNSKDNHFLSISKSPGLNGDICGSRSLREPRKESNNELANLRLPLSGTLKNHNNNLANHHRNSFTQLLQSNSNSNLSGVLQPTVSAVTRSRLKPSPTISTLVSHERADTNSIQSGQRIKFQITSEDQDQDEAPTNGMVNSNATAQLLTRHSLEDDASARCNPYSDVDDDDDLAALSNHLNSSKAHLLVADTASNEAAKRNGCGGGGGVSDGGSDGGGVGDISSTGDNSLYSISNSNNNSYSNIVKANNAKNLHLIGKSVPQKDYLLGTGGGSGANIVVGGVGAAVTAAAPVVDGVAQPLLGKINY
ncbi:atrial natriuretic peptide receptor 1 isoform X2 [Ceratitis capitata]|uniref:Guanylate cyclase n=1 Tax=Ceratitis capitata TaxID=7213 RepID=W8B2G3_CERCA|nr:atrial natriuretic peptide receptor 1 isoform X2 [Ceratitis capitata]